MSRERKWIAFRAGGGATEVSATEDIIHIERNADGIGIAIEAAC